MVRDFREEDAETPVVLMGYLNPILSYGIPRFCCDAAASGVDGLIVVDVPPEEAGEIEPHAREAGLDLIRLVAPTTDEARLPRVLAATTGFVYYVSITGITGTRSADRRAPGRSGAPHPPPHRPARRHRLRHPHAAAGRRSGAHRRRRRGRLRARRHARRRPRREGLRAARDTRGRCSTRCAPWRRRYAKRGARTTTDELDQRVGAAQDQDACSAARARCRTTSGTSAPNCEQLIFHRDLERALHVCTHCGHHMRIGAKQRLDITLDPGWQRIELPAPPPTRSASATSAATPTA